MALKPGSSTGNNGGIFQEISPSGHPRPNFATVADNKPLPPTTTPNATWKPIATTPKSRSR